MVVSTMVSLDGVMEAPEAWAFDFWDDDLGRWALEELLAADALLLGRVTYQGFLTYWPSVGDEDPLAARMNGIAKLVASTSLETVEWNATLIGPDVPGEVSRLKRELDRDILLLASADLMRTLAQHDLIDEYRLRIAPVVAGRGRRLFAGGIPATVLQTIETNVSASGVVVITLRVAR